MSLVSRLRILLDNAAWNSAPVVSGGPLSTDDEIVLLQDQTKGLKEAVLIIAEEFEQASKT